MDALLSISEMLSSPALGDFLSENVPGDKNLVDSLMMELVIFQKFITSTKCKMLPPDQKQTLIKGVRLTAHRVGNLMSEIVGRKGGSNIQTEGGLVEVWEKVIELIVGMILEGGSKEAEGGWEFFMFNYIDFQTLYNANKEIIDYMLHEATDSSKFETLNEWHSRALFFKKTFRAFEHLPNFKFKLYTELGNLPWLMCKACDGQPLAHLLIGGLLSLKPMTYDTWNRVNDDPVKIKETNNCVTSNNMWHVINYCYDDLPYYLKLCFLYFACYPIGDEIPATSLTNIWIAEGFVTPEQGEWVADGFVTPGKEETREETAYKYLEQLVQRSLVCVSKRSFLGTIKSCRVPRLVHEFAIKQSQMDGFLVANPDQEEIEFLLRLAIHHDNKKLYTEVKNNHIVSFLASSFDRNFLGSVVLLRVLELRNSLIPITALTNMICLRYLGLRGSNISGLPQNIGDMKNLQTLDVRDTCIETIPETLWNIKELRHVYVKPSPQNKGPPSKANISDLQVLKMVAAHESWAKSIPHFLIHLTKFAFSNWDNLDWKYISNLLSKMDKLISMAIIGNNIPSEFADTRAFPNLETVKSIKLEGKWSYWKLFIDNVKFPPNLTKLTLTNSGLKEDPMPTLEHLQSLKSLSLQDGAYTGNQIVCSSDGFPQLQFLELKKLDNLENWRVHRLVEKMGMPKLTTLRVVQCPKLNNFPNLDHVTDKVIDDVKVAFLVLL